VDNQVSIAQSADPPDNAVCIAYRRRVVVVQVEEGSMRYFMFPSDMHGNTRYDGVQRASRIYTCYYSVYTYLLDKGTTQLPRSHQR